MQGGSGMLARRLRLVRAAAPRAAPRPFVSSAIAANEFATGGLTVLAAGTSLAVLRAAAAKLGEWALRSLVVRAEVDDDDDAHRWLLAWLAARPGLLERGTRFTITTKVSPPLADIRG